MKHIKLFNESIINEFDPEDYKDYMLSVVEESLLQDSDTTDNYLFLEYNLKNDKKFKEIDDYLRYNNRFKNVVPMIGYDSGICDILIVSSDYYNKNIQYSVYNLKWSKHRLAEEMEKLTNKMKGGQYPDDTIKFMNRWEDAKYVTGLPDGVSIIKNINPGITEILTDDMSDPLSLGNNEECLFQYYIYKYICK